MKKIFPAAHLGYFAFTLGLFCAVVPHLALGASSFEPKNLVEIESALKKELKSHGKAGEGNPYGIIVNGLSPFWTATAIGSQVAATELGVAVSFQGPIKAEVQAQKDFIKTMVSSQYKGISLSPIAPAELSDAVKEARSKGIKILAIDSDLPTDQRELYLGTDNYHAGLEAGRALVKALGPSGGKVMGMVGYTTAPNAIERIRGIQEALKGSHVTLSSMLVDNIDLEKAASNASLAISSNPDLKAFITVYAYDGPAALKAIEQAGKVGKIKVVAFDLAAETLAGLKAGTVAAAIGQRPYYWGRLSVYLLHALNVLGTKETRSLIASNLEGPNHDLLDTGIDLVTPANVKSYLGYLSSIGIKQQ